MTALEPHQSLPKTSASKWLRFSRRQSRADAPPPAHEPAFSSHRPQKRTSKAMYGDTRTMIAHYQHSAASSAPSTPPDDQSIPTRRVMATDMQTASFPKSREVHTVAWNVFLPPESIYRLIMGFRPQQMEDKWFIYSEGPDSSGKLKIHFHRSWTGMKIAELFVVVDLKGEGAGKILGIKWNGTDQTNGMDEEEAKYMISTTCSWVLGVDIEKGLC